MKRLLTLSALLLTACGTIEEAQNNLKVGMDRKSFCKQFETVIVGDPCRITFGSRVEYFPDYRTEIYPSHSPLYDNSDRKKYWFVFENVNQITPVYVDGNGRQLSEFASNPGTFVMSTDNYQEAYMRATGGRMDGVRKVTKKPDGKLKETFVDKLAEAVIEGVAEGLVEVLVEKVIDCDGGEVKRVRQRTRPHPLGERQEIIVYKEDC
tara:strand:- start:452 stop:1075 length:624 start_codon:yes stop_codon:yes gene_type:complete